MSIIEETNIILLFDVEKKNHSLVRYQNNVQNIWSCMGCPLVLSLSIVFHNPHR